MENFSSSAQLYQGVRAVMRLRHMSLSTEDTYLHWIRRFIEFYGRRHPLNLGAIEVREFLSDLAVRGNVTASTQNVALNALVFLFHQVLERELGDVSTMLRAPRSKRVPVVWTRQEVQAVLSHLDGQMHLMASLLYGSGLRLMECLRLHVKDMNFGTHQLVARQGEGNKDCISLLPQSLEPLLRRQLKRSLTLYQLANGVAPVALDGCMTRSG